MDKISSKCLDFCHPPPFSLASVKTKDEDRIPYNHYNKIIPPSLKIQVALIFLPPTD